MRNNSITHLDIVRLNGSSALLKPVYSVSARGSKEGVVFGLCNTCDSFSRSIGEINGLHRDSFLVLNFNLQHNRSFSALTQYGELTRVVTSSDSAQLDIRPDRIAT